MKEKKSLLYIGCGTINVLKYIIPLDELTDTYYKCYTKILEP